MKIATLFLGVVLAMTSDMSSALALECSGTLAEPPEAGQGQENEGGNSFQSVTSEVVTREMCKDVRSASAEADGKCEIGPFPDQPELCLCDEDCWYSEDGGKCIRAEEQKTRDGCYATGRVIASISCTFPPPSGGTCVRVRAWRDCPSNCCETREVYDQLHQTAWEHACGIVKNHWCKDVFGIVCRTTGTSIKTCFWYGS